jgi:hypothetical protein
MTCAGAAWWLPDGAADEWCAAMPAPPASSTAAAAMAFVQPAAGSEIAAAVWTWSARTRRKAGIGTIAATRRSDSRTRCWVRVAVSTPAA